MGVLFDEDDVLAIANQAVDVVQGGLGLGERDDDLLNLVVNAVSSLVKRPQSDWPDLELDTVIEENCETEPSEVRSWWSDWS